MSLRFLCDISQNLQLYLHPRNLILKQAINFYYDKGSY